MLRKRRLKGNLSSNKMQPRFDGPFKVKVVRGNGVAYVLESACGSRELRAHHSQLRRYIETPEYLRSNIPNCGDGFSSLQHLVFSDESYLTDDESVVDFVVADTSTISSIFESLGSDHASVPAGLPEFYDSHVPSSA